MPQERQDPRDALAGDHDARGANCAGEEGFRGGEEAHGRSAREGADLEEAPPRKLAVFMLQAGEWATYRIEAFPPG
jgi:hypothetical protein